MSSTGDPVRLLLFIKKNDRLSDQEFEKYWREEHAPKAIPILKRHHVLFYSQTHTPKAVSDSTAQFLLGGNADTLDYSVIATNVFASLTDAEALWKDPEFAAVMKEDSAYLSQVDKTCIADGKEIVFIGTGASLV